MPVGYAGGERKCETRAVRDSLSGARDEVMPSSAAPRHVVDGWFVIDRRGPRPV